MTTIPRESNFNTWLLSPGNWISVTTQFSVFLLFARFSCFLFFFPRPSLSSRVTRPIVLTPPLFYFYPDKKLRQKHIAIHYTIHSDNIKKKKEKHKRTLLSAKRYVQIKKENKTKQKIYFQIKIKIKNKRKQNITKQTKQQTTPK